MPCQCPPEEAKCPGCPRNDLCKHWIPSKNSKFYRCGDRTQFGLCKRSKDDCPTCPHFKPPGLPGRPRVIDEFDRMEVDDPLWNDPRTWGEEIDPVKSHRESNRRYKSRKREEGELPGNSAEYQRVYMREYRRKKKEAKQGAGGGGP